MRVECSKSAREAIDVGLRAGAFSGVLVVSMARASDLSPEGLAAQQASLYSIAHCAR